MMLNAVTAQNLLSKIIIFDRESLSSFIFVISQASILSNRSILFPNPALKKILILKLL